MSEADRLPPELAPLVEAAAKLAVGPRRRMLGLTGPPGAGKSVLAEALQRALGERAVVVGMDGFHLAQVELARLGRTQRKGAPDTFDAAGYVALLRRLREQDEPVVYAPWFDRRLEEPIAGAVPVLREAPLVITEGNYLLLETDGFAPVAGLLDECWYLDPPDELRLRRLVDRHRRCGRDPAQAYGSDQRNAVLISVTRGRANRVVRDNGGPLSGAGS